MHKTWKKKIGSHVFLVVSNLQVVIVQEKIYQTFENICIHRKTNQPVAVGEIFWSGDQTKWPCGPYTQNRRYSTPDFSIHLALFVSHPSHTAHGPTTNGGLNTFS